MPPTTPSSGSQLPAAPVTTNPKRTSSSALERSALNSGSTPGDLRKCSKKVILLGHFGVGKSSLVQRFVHSIFSTDYQTTIGVKLDKKIVQTPTHEMKMVLWDIEGGADQTRLPASYFMGAHGIIYVCDVTRPATFRDLDKTLPQLAEKSPNAPVVVIGNKIDLLPADQQAVFTASEMQTFDFLSLSLIHI